MTSLEDILGWDAVRVGSLSRDTPEYQTSPCKDIVFRAVNNAGDSFLTGGGGVGKTYLTNLICKHPDIRAVKLASTGPAASLIDGMTVHRFFKLGISNTIEQLDAWDKRNARSFGDRINVPEEEADRILKNLIRKNLYDINLIVIDEVSMLSAKMVDIIHYRLRHQLKVDIPILWVGDFFQIPPVDKKGDLGMAFQSRYWNPKVFELTTIRRTENVEFAKIQHKIRYGINSPEVIDYVRSLQNNAYDEGTLHLFSTNREIDSHNLDMLRSLDGEPMKVGFKFNDLLYKEEDALKYIKSDLLINPIFYFKFGARVIFVNNNYDMDGNLIWYNGESGTLISFEAGAFTVLKDDGVTVSVPRWEFKREELVKGELKVTMAIRQFPLRIAYAISIHKSQGMSLSRGHVDCKQFFLPEQFFVAISRFTNPKSLSLVGFNNKLIAANPLVLDYYENCGMTSY